MENPTSGRQARWLVIGAVAGAAVGVLVLQTAGDDRSCANDVGPGFCRLGQGAVVIGAAGLGALAGWWIAGQD